MLIKVVPLFYNSVKFDVPQCFQVISNPADFSHFSFLFSLPSQLLLPCPLLASLFRSVSVPVSLFPPPPLPHTPTHTPPLQDQSPHFHSGDVFKWFSTASLQSKGNRSLQHYNTIPINTLMSFFFSFFILHIFMQLKFYWTCVFVSFIFT